MILCLTIVDCIWAAWSESTCTATCGNSVVKKKSRIKAIEASNGGSECLGKTSATVTCNVPECPSKYAIKSIRENPPIVIYYTHKCKCVLNLCVVMVKRS